MLKRLAVLVALIFVVHSFCPEPNVAANPKAGPRDQRTQNADSSPTPTSSAVRESGSENGPTSIYNVPQKQDKDVWDKFSVLGNISIAVVGVGGILVGIFTLRRLKEQNRIAALSAKAASENTQFLIDSKRAWLDVTMGDVKFSDLFVDTSALTIFIMRPTITNYGKTVTRIKSMYLRKHICESDSRLPQEPVYESPETVYFVGELLMVPASKKTPLYVSTSSIEFQKIKNSGESLYLYGYVRYEILGEPGTTERETRFCFIYHIPGGFSGDPEGFHMPTGLPQYNRAT